MSRLTNHIEKAIDELLCSKPLAIPTETVYGLAALADDEQGLRAVFAMKQRPLNHPLIVHVSDLSMVEERLELIPDYAITLMEAFWPGPLTLVFKTKPDAFHPLVTGNQQTVAVRCPNHPLTLDLLTQLGKPVVAPSANPFGKVSPTKAEHVLDSFPDESLMVLDGGRCEVGIESTIVDATSPNEYRILRHGLLSADDLNDRVQGLVSINDSKIRVSGALKQHYQPEKPLIYFNDQEQLEDYCRNHRHLFVISRQKPAMLIDSEFRRFSSKPAEAAYDLYHYLREADTSAFETILIECPQETAAFKGVIERIYKAGRPFL